MARGKEGWRQLNVYEHMLHGGAVLKIGLGHSTSCRVLIWCKGTPVLSIYTFWRIYKNISHSHKNRLYYGTRITTALRTYNNEQESECSDTTRPRTKDTKNIKKKESS